jgi:hypothetical protein
MTHTPGPWRLNDERDFPVDNKYDDYQTIAAAGGYLSDGFCITGYLRLADANLIIAAPDMYDVLQKIAEWAEPTGVEGLDQKDALERLNICRVLALEVLGKAGHGIRIHGRVHWPCRSRLGLHRCRLLDR